jgi:CHAD domain-containing protein
MSTVLTVAGAPTAHRGLSHWMERVLKELEHVRKDPAADPVHDLRVAIRRCRSVAAVMQEVDPDSTWRQMRQVPKKLFRRLGALRDAQVMDEWVKHLAPSEDPLRTKLHASFAANQPDLRQRVLRAVEKFEERYWDRLERKLRKRARVVPCSSLAAQCLAVERFEEAKELHARAQRTDKPKAWHELRIGLKRLRYTVESLLPEQYALWSDNLKRLQDLLGEVHDLDVLAATVKQFASQDTLEVQNNWEEIIRRERHERIETYRQLTLGRTVMVFHKASAWLSRPWHVFAPRRAPPTLDRVAPRKSRESLSRCSTLCAARMLHRRSMNTSCAASCEPPPACTTRARRTAASPHRKPRCASCATCRCLPVGPSRSGNCWDGRSATIAEPNLRPRTVTFPS